MNSKEVINDPTTHDEKNLQSDVGNTEVLASWEIKAHAHPTRFMDIGMAIFSLFPIAFYIYGVFFMKMKIPDIQY